MPATPMCEFGRPEKARGAVTAGELAERFVMDIKIVERTLPKLFGNVFFGLKWNKIKQRLLEMSSGMLNAIWAVMILLAVAYGALTGNMREVTEGALDSAGEAVSLCITMAGVVALWMGLMEIAKKAGLIDKLTRGVSPFLTFMFPRIPKEHEARGYIATNIIANVLGLGWACTPAGLKAMEALAKLEAERGTPGYEDEIAGKETSLKGIAGKGTAGMADRRGVSTERRASEEMCNFLILNISSLQLIPVNMIAYRSQYGSANPASIIAPAIVATLISTLTAIIYCKCADGKNREKRLDRRRIEKKRGILI